MPADLQTFFNIKKREKDREQLGTPSDSENGIYTFLRQFTNPLDEKSPTTYNEHQRLDINKMSQDIFEMEKKQFTQRTLASHATITANEREEAETTLKQKLELT
jgi:hypothetical protein